MKRWFVLPLALALATATAVGAEVYQGGRKAVPGLENAQQVSVTADGRRIFVLDKKGTLTILDNRGGLEGTLDLGKEVTSIEPVGRGEQIILVSRDKGVEIVSLTFKQEIDVSDATIRGNAKAPVTLAVFTDFQ